MHPLDLQKAESCFITIPTSLHYLVASEFGGIRTLTPEMLEEVQYCTGVPNAVANTSYSSHLRTEQALGVVKLDACFRFLSTDVTCSVV